MKTSEILKARSGGKRWLLWILRRTNCENRKDSGTYRLFCAFPNGGTIRGGTCARARSRSVLIHVVEPLPYRSARWDEPTRLLDHHLKVASAKMEELEREVMHPQDKCRRELHFGVVHEVISERASKLKVDLIIISMPVRTHLLDLLIGSTANKILRYVPTPVLRLRAV